MSMHVFGAIVTYHGIAANNRGESEGNITTLQKIIWHGQPHTTVSAEAIRFALRRLIAGDGKNEVNRTWNEDERVNSWKNDSFDPARYIDDDLLGYMTAEGAEEEGEKGTATTRRAVLDVSRAISLVPWCGDVTFNAASIGASSGSKGDNPAPYGTEVHATRYQYGFALTPDRLKKKKRANTAIEKLCALGPVAGNNARFLFDFSPESVVFRITEDPAPRILYIFEQDGNDTVEAPELLRRLDAGDIKADELIVGGRLAGSKTGEKLKKKNVTVEPGVIKAAELVIKKIGE